MILKRITALILLLSVFVSLIGCVEERAALNEPGAALPPGSVEQPELNDDPTDDFTVRLRLNEEDYVPTVAVKVYWNDGYNIHVAPMDKNGVARIDGLDGDYKVTLNGAPSGYTYDPNAYTATNDNRNITIDMYDSGSVNPKETGLYNSYRVNETGVYTVTIYDDPGDANQDGSEVDTAYFEFAPQTNGVYTIESWVNTVDDSVNPVCIAYHGSSQYKHSPYRVTDVGACGSYTRNFIHTVKIADENIGSSGSQSFSFAITAQTKSGVYPVTFSFAIKRDGGFDYNRPGKTTVVPKFDWSSFNFDAFNALAGSDRVSAHILQDGSKVFAEYDYVSGKYNYKVWEVADGGDGVYHVYDEVKYASTNGYGPVLFAYIDSPCDYLESAISHIEDAGNNALTVNGGTENYRQFIRGFDSMTQNPGADFVPGINQSTGGLGFYCTFDCPCHADGSPLACLPGCDTCTAFCRPCPPELFGKKGYAEMCNSDGVVPVTPELKEFLQKFAISGYYFADGEGFVDSRGVYAYEDAQWLFACGYYEEAAD